METPNKKVLKEQAVEFLSWTTDRIDDLDSLISDHSFLKEPKNNILIAIDFFDILQVTFPYANPIESYGSTVLSEEFRNKILREFIGRLSLLFGLHNNTNRSYYPIWMPYPYIEEFYSSFSRPGINSSSIKSLESQLRDLDKKAVEIFGDDLKALLEELQHGNVRDGLLEFIIEISPELFFIVSGAHSKGIKTVEKLFQNDILTMNIQEWGIPSDILQKVYSNKKFKGFVEDDNQRWIDIFTEEARVNNLSFKSSWLKDIHSIRLISHLNKVLSQDNIRILFVSSAFIVNKVLSKYKNLTPLYDIKGKEIPDSTFYRSLDVFRFHDRFTASMNGEIDEETIINLATKDRNQMKEVLALDNQELIQKIINDPENFVANNDEEKLSNQKISELFQMIEDINRIREKLFKTHLFCSSKLFEEYLSSDKNQILVPGDGSDNSIYNKTISIINEIHEASKIHGLDIYEIIIKLKALMSAEFRLWVTISRLKSVKPVSDEVRILFHKFTLFPFRILFSNHLLLDKIEKLKNIVINPKKNPSDQELKEFHSTLLKIATSCSAHDKNKFWEISDNLLSIDKNSIERRLVIVLLLFSLSMYKEAYHSAEQLYSISAINNFKVELLIISIQARLREFWEEKKHISLVSEQEMIILDIVKRCDSFQDHQDARLQYLAGFAFGFSSRNNSEFRKKAIDRCLIAKNLIEKQIEDIDEDISSQTKEIASLKGTLLISYSYYLSIEGLELEDKNLIITSIKCIETEVFKNIEENELTSICLQNIGYVYHVAMKLSTSVEDLVFYFNKAKYYYDLAEERVLDRALIKRALFNKTQEYCSKLDVEINDIKNFTNTFVDIFEESPNILNKNLIVLKKRWANLDRKAKKGINKLKDTFTQRESRLTKDMIDLKDSYYKKKINLNITGKE